MQKEQAIIGAYVESFNKHYPHSAVRIEKQKGKYKVLINNDAGNMLFDLSDLQEATAEFKR